MKVKNTGDRIHSSGSPTKGVAVRKDSEKKVDFLKSLNSVGQKIHKEEVELLVQKIIEQGEKLAKSKDIKELRIYRKLISSFMQKILSGSHEFTKRDHIDRRGRHRVYSIIR